MKIVDRIPQQRTTGLVGRIREADSKGELTVELTTAADVFGYVNLRTHLIKIGYDTCARRVGKRIVVYLQPFDAPRSTPVKSMFSKRCIALLQSLKANQCVLLSTPQEAFNYMNVRKDMIKTINCKASRIGDSVALWRK